MTTSTASTEKRVKRTHHRALLASLPKADKKSWQYVESHPIPIPGKGQVLVETTYVGLNPFDWQGVAYRYAVGEEPKVMGRDGAGVVLELGEGVETFKIGDRVWYCANSSAKGTGAFQESSIHSASEIGHIPPDMSDIEAATLGTGLITAGVALFRTLGIPLASLESAIAGEKEKIAEKEERAKTMDSGSVQSQEEKRKDERPWMLIWGGAGITGIFLIQLAVLLNYRVICLASTENHTYVKSLGAEIVLDRWLNHDILVGKIREETNDNVLIAIDNVGSTTATLCQHVLQGSQTFRSTHNLPIPPLDPSKPAQLVPLAGSPTPPSSPSNETNSDIIRQVTPLRISFSTTFYNHPDFSIPLLQHLDTLLLHRRIIPARTQVIVGGLAGIERGLEDLRYGRVKGGYKLVARVADTPDVVVLGQKRPREEEVVVQEKAVVVQEKEVVVERPVKRSRKSDVNVTTKTTYLTKAVPAVQEVAITQAWQCMARDG